MTVVAFPQSRPGLRVERVSDAYSLQEWLSDRWAILFSHPEDFAQEQLEMDRWVRILGRSFAERGVAPVGVVVAGSRSVSGSESGSQSGSEFGSVQGWLESVAALDGGSAAVLALDHTAADLPARTLRARIARSGPRFAMIIDSSLGCRRTLSYRLPAELPSPFDLIGCATVLRKRGSDPGSRHEAPEASLPAIRSSRVGDARRSAYQR